MLFPCRLAEKMASASLQQTESKLVADVQALEAYVGQKQDHSNRQAGTHQKCFAALFPHIALTTGYRWQGALDMRFLASRFEKGKAWIETYMGQNHEYLQVSAENGHADILRFYQQHSCSDPWLGFLIRRCLLIASMSS